MAQLLSPAEKLRIQFRKALRRGYTKNAELDPCAPVSLLGLDENETLIVRVDSTDGKRYWFTDRRVMCEASGVNHELLRYDAVTEAHWMSRYLRTDPTKLKGVFEDGGVQFKRDHFDRLEIETSEGLVVLAGLAQAYRPVLQFFWWLEPSKQADRP